MKTIQRALRIILLMAGMGVLLVGAGPVPSRTPDVHYQPTPQLIVEELLKMAEVNRNDVVYDLGCGDGRFVITAAKKYGARGVGIDIDPERIQDSNQNARTAGVLNKVKFIEGDLFQTDFREATVVALYLLQDLNMQLRPTLLKDLKPGTRVVSHEFDMYDWQPDKMGRLGRNKYYFWVIPADVAGKWHWSFPSGKGGEPFVLSLIQKFQDIDGWITTPAKTVSPLEAYLVGRQIGFVLRYQPSGKSVEMRFSGRVEGNTMSGIVDVNSGPFAGRHNWTAKR